MKDWEQLERMSVDDLRRSIDVADLVAYLSYSAKDAANASRVQPVLFYLAAKNRHKKMLSRQQAEAALKEAKSRIGSRVRRKLADRGIRVTEGMVSEELALNDEIRELEARLAKKEAAEESAKLLLEAYRHRKDSLRLTADFLAAEIYVQRKLDGFDTQSDGIRETLRNQVHDKWPKRKRKE